MEEEHNKPPLPIIDLEAFCSSSAESSSTSSIEKRLKTGKQLVSACHDVGFVYIKNHGVPEDELSRAFDVSKKWFDLSTDQKMKAPHPPGWAVHRGYSWPGLEKVSNLVSGTAADADSGENDGDENEFVVKLRQVQDFKESYEVGSDQNPDQPNVWPPTDVLPEWQPCMSSFYWTCFDAGKRILRALALGLGLDQDHLLRFHSGDYNQLRLLHYPPIPAAAIDEGKFARMPAHTDWSTITLLFQDDCGGLQVEHPRKPGEFIDATPIPGTLVMNVGDLLMRWSNDHLKSTSHRVQLPPLQDRFTGTSRLTRARYSIPYFLTTDPDLLIECLTVDEHHPPEYEPITQRDYAAMRARMQY